MKKQAIQYEAGLSGFFNKNNVQAYGEELARIVENNNGEIPKLVVEAAASIKSPLHECFEWDDSIAAHTHRLHTARQLLGFVCVVAKIVGDTKPATLEKTIVRAFLNVTTEEGKRSYVTRQSVSENANYRQQLISECVGKLTYIGEKLSQFRDLDKQVIALAKIKDKIAETAIPAETCAA